MCRGLFHRCDSRLQLLFTPQLCLSRKEAGATCVCVCLCVCVSQCCTCVCGREAEGFGSYYIKQDFPEQSAPATDFPKPSSGFPLRREVGGLSEGRLFVLERHCSGAAEAMSQHRCHSLCPPATRCSIIKRLLLCHLASFPWRYLYSPTRTR